MCRRAEMFLVANRYLGIEMKVDGDRSFVSSPLDNVVDTGMAVTKERLSMFQSLLSRRAD